jgi:tetratricopeptide (TPR) repeat protein
MKRHLALASIVGFVLVVAGCAPKAITPVSEEDNPAHHYLMGMEMIDKQDVQGAQARFDRALELDRKYAPAMAGKALVAAMRTGAETDKEHQSVELERALDLLDKADSAADGDSQEFQVRVTGIRVYTHARPKKWINGAEKQYKKAMGLKKVKSEELPYYRSMEAASYFMGMAYYKAYQFRDAEDALSKVMSASPGRWHEPASKLFNKVHKIIRASASFTLTDVAKKIAVKEEVCRADAAALLVDEVHLDRLMAGRLGGPEKKGEPEFVPADIADNMFKPEILIVQKWGVRGLEPTYDKTSKAYLFHPAKPISRKELAFSLEDLLIKITGDNTLATKYIGQTNSPYPDVPTTSAGFNSVMNAVTRGLMEPDISGAFRPDDNTDGAELLLAVMRLRNVMNIK